MDVEKTIQAILESQLRAEKRADRADERADRADQRMDRAEKRADKFDKQILAIRDLVREGMKYIEKNLKALTVAQNRTEEKLNRLLEQLGRKSNNGHRKGLH